MMIDPNIDAERFFTYVLPAFIVFFIMDCNGPINLDTFQATFFNSAIFWAGVIYPMTEWMMIDPNIDAERFFTYVLPAFIVSFIVIIIFTILFANKPIYIWMNYSTKEKYRIIQNAWSYIK
jgi:hypothetical protein